MVAIEIYNKRERDRERERERERESKVGEIFVSEKNNISVQMEAITM